MQSVRNLKGAVEALTVYNNLRKANPSPEMDAYIKANIRINQVTFDNLQEPDEKTKVIKHPELIALVNELGLVGKGAAVSTSSGDGKGSTNFALLKTQHPTEGAAIQAALDVISATKGFAVKRDDGSEDVITVQVAFKSANSKGKKSTESIPVNL